MTSHLHPDDLVCARCNNSRPASDMAHINDKPYCHPAWSTRSTCYERATWEVSETRKHRSSHADFYAVLRWSRDGIGPVTQAVLADRLVHLVVLHGLLPELEEPAMEPRQLRELHHAQRLAMDNTTGPGDWCVICKTMIFEGEPWEPVSKHRHPAHTACVDELRVELRIENAGLRKQIEAWETWIKS